MWLIIGQMESIHLTAVSHMDIGCHHSMGLLGTRAQVILHDCHVGLNKELCLLTADAISAAAHQEPINPSEDPPDAKRRRQGIYSLHHCCSPEQDRCLKSCLQLHG